MKYLIMSLFVVSGFASAESVVKNISSQRDWRSRIVKDHKLHGGDACIAQTSKGVLRLEVFTGKMQQGTYTEPTVQVIADGRRFPKFHRAKLRFNDGKMYRLTLARVSGQARNVQALVVRFEDRENVVQAIRALSTATVDFYNTRGSKVSSNRFSLRGSSHNVNKMMNHCDVAFENLDL